MSYLWQIFNANSFCGFENREAAKGTYNGKITVIPSYYLLKNYRNTDSNNQDQLFFAL